MVEVQALNFFESDNLIYQGIAERNFDRSSACRPCSDQMASLENGLLQVDLLRVVQRR